MTLLQLAWIRSGGSRDAGMDWIVPGQHWVPGLRSCAPAAIGWCQSLAMGWADQPRFADSAISHRSVRQWRVGCVSGTTGLPGAIAGGLMLMQPVGAFSASGLIVLLHQGQLRRRPAPEGMACQLVASRSPEVRRRAARPLQPSRPSGRFRGALTMALLLERVPGWPCSVATPPTTAGLRSRSAACAAIGQQPPV
jgi:hypothetical protein